MSGSMSQHFHHAYSYAFPLTCPVSIVIAVYGLVVSVLIAGNSTSFLCPCIDRYVSDDVLVVSPSEPYSLFAGFVHLAAGLGKSFARIVRKSPFNRVNWLNDRSMWFHWVGGRICYRDCRGCCASYCLPSLRKIS